MFGVIISYFDSLSGPRILMKIPNCYPQGVDHIPFLMDFYDDGFFIHEFGELKTANLIFEIYSPINRGEREIILLTIVLYQESYNINLSSFKPILEYFAGELSNIPDIFKGFHCDDISAGNKQFKQISDLVFILYNSIPTDTNQHFNKIVTYELSENGKASIINEIKEKLPNANKNSIGKLKISHPLTSP